MPQVAARPLELGDLDAAFAPLRSLDSLLLAVSGGADSLALMILCQAWVQERAIPIKLHVASVDHGLRPEAANECAYVAKLALERGLSHATLRWNAGDEVKSNIQAQARNARYRLLREEAARLDCGHIALAHHLDDQAETVIMRLMRGSGVSGLGAMRAEQALQDLTLLRPFLDIPKARLAASLAARNVDWIEDPSNHNDDFMRVRVRELMPLLAQEGCDAKRLASTARRFQRADSGLEQVCTGFFLRHMRTEIGRALSVSMGDFAEQPEDIRLRLFRNVIAHVAGGEYPPREEKLLFLDKELLEARSESRGQKMTASGCCFELVDDRLWIFREPGRAPASFRMERGDPQDWLGLYNICVNTDNTANHRFELRRLGADGRKQLAAMGVSVSDADRGNVPAGLLEAVPSVWMNDELHSVVDMPQVARMTGAMVKIEEKDTKSGFREALN